VLCIGHWHDWTVAFFAALQRRHLGVTTFLSTGTEFALFQFHALATSIRWSVVRQQSAIWQRRRVSVSVARILRVIILFVMATSHDFCCAIFRRRLEAAAHAGLRGVYAAGRTHHAGALQSETNPVLAIALILAVVTVLSLHSRRLSERRIDQASSRLATMVSSKSAAWTESPKSAPRLCLFPASAWPCFATMARFRDLQRLQHQNGH